MDDTIYKSILKDKKIQLINSLNLLGNTIKLKLKERDNKIIELNQKAKEPTIDNSIEDYKIAKNKELDNLKLELNNILKDIDSIVNNITTNIEKK